MKDTLVLNEGGAVTIDGGNITTDINNTRALFIGRESASFTFKGNGTYTQSGSDYLIQLGTDLDNTTVRNVGTVVIENGTFSGLMPIYINGIANVTINSGTFNCSGGLFLRITAQGKTSNIKINDITATVMGFVCVTGGMQNKVVFNNGKVKYQPGVFSTTNSGSPSTDIILNNGMFGPVSGSTDIHDELDGLKGTGATITAISESGYTYKLEGGGTPTPPDPTPTPYHGGGSSGGGSSSGGSPRVDSSGNILGPSGKQTYSYDGSNPPNLTGTITVSNWNYNTGNAQAADIHYVQNVDSFVRGDNTPVVTEWVGVAGENNSKLVWYRTDATGQILRNQFIELGGNIYYLDNNGIMVTGQFTINGVTYNFETTVGATEGRLLF